ncbi:unnamed protein product [Schistosoma margrebowiei]|uniref:Large ribosomal subunit protein eL6 n=1 Tax=Schistosoma margrebowiei TaxID=48269 RepID=A0A183L8T7_9TREM|nr:unnamed protein product [Schistosoma margrebowiei]
MRSDSNELDQKNEPTIITTEQHPTIHIEIDQTIKNTCTLKQSKVEINDTEQQHQQQEQRQQQNEYPNQSNNPIHQKINNDSTNLPMINNQNIITVNDKYIDENMRTVQENMISSINNDILLKNTEQMITNLIVTNQNENNFIESIKQIDNEMKSSIIDPIKSINSDKKSIKKSKKKQKHVLSLEKNTSDITMDTNLLLPIENTTLDHEHNEFISSIITSDINNSGINITDVTSTTTTTTSSIQNEISSLQFNINDDLSTINNVIEIDPQYNKKYIENSMKHLKKDQKSINKEIELKEQYEQNIQPLNCSFISESTDNEHNESNDITLSSIEISIHKEDPVRLNVLQNDKPMSISTHLLTESNQFTKCCLFNETNQETDLELNHEIIQNNEISKQTIEKSNQKKQIIDNSLEQTIDQEISINDPVHSESINLINQQSSQFITDSLSISELLIIPQKIQSISKTPQGIHEEGDIDNHNNNVELLSPPELISDEKNFKKGSKKSRKKHEKKHSDIDNTIEQDSCIIVHEEEKMMKKKKEKKNTTDSKNDHLHEVNMHDIEMTSESINKEYINPSMMSFSDPSFLELNNTNSQLECCIEQTSNKQPTIILVTNNSSKQVLNESQMIESNDNTVHTEITHISSTILVDNHDDTSEYIEKVQFNNNNNDNDTLIEQSSLRKGDINVMTKELTLCDSDLNIKHQDTNKNSLKQSKKKQKKTNQPIEKNIKAVESHKNTIHTSIPQSIATTIDINRTVDSPLSTDIKLKEPTQQLTPSLSSNDLVSQPTDGFSKKSSRNKKTKKVKIQSNESDVNYFSKSTSTILPNSLIPVNEVHTTEYSNSSYNSGRNTKNNFTSISIPFCKTICKVSHEELQNSLSHRNTSNLKAKNKKLHLKHNKLKSSKTNVLNQLDNTFNNKSVINEITMGQSSQTVTEEEETQENTRKRRFPKSFITQVDPKYIRSARLAAKRRKTDSTNQPKETSSSTDKRKTSMKQKSKKILKKWRLRPSLRENGVIVILLAGRHRGKRVVSLGRQKSTGLLLVTGPYCYNGCPLRRVHPDYVIATKTKIDLSSLSLPERIHAKKYFTRTTKCKSFKTKFNHNQFDEILEHGINAKRSTYKPNDEKKTDQIYIDNEVRKAIKSHTDSKLLIGYLKSLFTIGKHDKPHEMLF